MLSCRRFSQGIHPFHPQCANVLPTATAPVSSSTIPASLDKQMDKQTPSNGHVMPGVSIRNGPMTEDTTMLDVNGASAKRKARESMARPNYAESESSDDDKPLVCSHNPADVH